MPTFPEPSNAIEAEIFDCLRAIHEDLESTKAQAAEIMQILTRMEADVAGFVTVRSNLRQSQQT